MSVLWIWSGATTDDGAVVKARLDAAATTARLVVSASEDLSSPVYSSAVAPDVDKYLHLTIAGLTPGAKWHYGIEVDATLDPIRGAFRTLPTDGAAADFLVGFASCAQTNPGRDYPVYQRIIEKDPVQFIHMGDFHYDIPSNPDESTWVAADWQGFVDRAFDQQPNRSAQHRAMAVPSIWDDHDYNPNQVGSKSFVKKDVAAAVARQTRPLYPTNGGGNAIGQSWRVGRVAFIMPDMRYHRDQYTEVTPTGATTGTMLGATQKQWVKDELEAARDDGCQLIVFVSSSIWTNTQHADTWGPAGDERDELSKFSVDESIPPVIVFSGDMHGLAWAEGMPLGAGTRPWPEHVSASLAASAGAGRPSAYWTFERVMAMGQYSTLEVEDDGTTFSYTVTGYQTDLITGAEIVKYRTVDNVLTFPDPGDPGAGSLEAIYGGWVDVSLKWWDGTTWNKHPAKRWDVASETWIPVRTHIQGLEALVVDLFDRGDASTLGTSDSGQAWTAYLGVWGISGNAAYLVSSGASLNIARLDAGAADVIVVGKVAGATADDIGLAVRTASTSHIYTTPTELRKRIGGTSAVVLATFTEAVAVGDTVAVAALGDLLVVYKQTASAGDFIEIGRVTETLNQTTTTHGMRHGSTLSGGRIDDFRVYKIG